MNFEIREAALHDYDGIRKLTAEVYQLHLKNKPDVYLDIDNPLEKDYFHELLNSGDTKIFAAEDCGSHELIAYSIVKIIIPKSPICIPKKYLYVDDFCVRSDCKRSGVGRQLVAHIVSYAKEQNISSIQLKVWEFNQDAVQFYEAMGMSTRNRTMELMLP